LGEYVKERAKEGHDSLSSPAVTVDLTDGMFVKSPKVPRTLRTHTVHRQRRRAPCH
jgi:hypothetical protein